MNDMRVTSTDGTVVLRFTDKGVIIQLACDKALIPWNEWEFLCKVYGRRASRKTEEA